MQGLMRKLAGLDSDAERGVRLIEFFDQLVAHRADLEAVVRATAVLADATVGALDECLGPACVVDPHGVRLPPFGPSSSAIVQDVMVDGARVGRVWLERGAETAVWDELITARMALALAAVHDRQLAGNARDSHIGLSDPAVLQILLRPEADEAEISRAVSLLGFAPGQHVNVIALTAARDIHRAVEQCRAALQDSTGGRVVVAVLSERLAVMVTPEAVDEVALPEGVAGCISGVVPVERCAAAWQGARKGVRFAALKVTHSRWQRLDELGALVLLADLPAAAVQALPDIQAIAAVAARRRGDVDVQLIEAVCLSASVREAAASLHLHHSSAGYRLDAIERVLGFDVRTAAGRYRARTALLLWQLNWTADSMTGQRQVADLDA